jgi:hypothetical protein
MRRVGNAADRGFLPRVTGQDHEAGMGEREVLPGVRL